MAYANVTRTGEWGIGHMVGTFLAKLNDQRRRNAVYRQTVRELNVLSDRDLADLGIARPMIKSVAYEAAYGR